MWRTNVLVHTNQQFYSGPQVLMLAYTLLWLQHTNDAFVVTPLGCKNVNLSDAFR